MKIYSVGTFIKLREKFKNSEEIGKAINRSKAAVMKRLQTGFTETEQILILRYLGIENNETNRKELFTK